MFRVQWHRPTLFVMCFFLFLLLMPCAVAGGCWYKDELHAEGTEVPTPEPCLNCTCNKGALLCYLRVCPTLPNPPPPGCILLHKFETCCPELICSDGHNYVEARSDPDEYNLLGENSNLEEAACIVNGSVYGPGSAMDSSSLCEYCYCLGGKQVCVSPKCLLHIEDCLPKYDQSNCCPSHYDCNYATTTISTTTRKSTKLIGKNKGGCVVDGLYYKEGDKVLGAGHSECDNCYCLRGVLRCEPLACAPPLFGCAPVIRTGECCAVSYNCSGTIEINPEPNYEVPIVSKQYAKFHKEIQQPIFDDRGKKSSTEISHLLNYDLSEISQTAKIQRNTDSVSSTLHFESSTTVENTKPTEEISSSNEKNATILSTNRTNVYYTIGLDDNITSETTSVSVIDDRLKRKIAANEKNSIEEDTITTTDETTTDFIETTSDYSTEEYLTESTLNLVDTDIPLETTANVVTVQTVLNSTDCIKPDNSDELYSENDTNTQQTTHNPTLHSPDVISNNSVEMKNNNEANATIITTVDAVSAEHETLSEKNGNTETFNKETGLDYEYDYNEPSLPPSLPNLRIIPFLAADALDLKSAEESDVYSPKELVTDSSYMNYHLFSPPVETEGGFIPKEPPILDNLYENTIASTTNIPKLHEISCLLENQEIVHGDIVPSKSHCEACRCFYGNIVCQKVKCPGPQFGCKGSMEKHLASCCPNYICDNEVPASMDRIDINLNPEESISEPQSFYSDEVIPTNPASNVEITSTSSTTTNTVLFIEDSGSSTSSDFSNTSIKNSKFAEDNISTEDKLVDLLYRSKLDNQPTLPHTTPTIFTTTNTKAEGKRSDGGHRNSINPPNIAVLKLAGCNIYGRMYRVGRIISELSNPCLECKCTEIGVQCEALNC